MSISCFRYCVSGSIDRVKKSTVRESDRVETEEIEISLLLEGLYRVYGFDFREYSRPSIKRRLLELMQREGLNTISAFQDVLLHDQSCLNRLLLGLAVHSTTMFRDPGF